MIIIKRTSFFFSLALGFTFFYGCNSNTIKDLEKRIAELEAQKPDTVIITNTDTIVISNIDTIQIFDTIYMVSDSVFIGDISLDGQEAVNVFGAFGFKTIIGNLWFGSISSDPLTDLTPLINLKEVIGTLGISTEGTDLTGLDNLIRVTDEIYFEGGIGNLQSFKGLDSLKSVNGIYIYGASALTNISALSNVTSSFDRLVFYNCPALTNLNGLEGVASLGSALEIINNTSLTNFCGIKTAFENFDVANNTLNISGNAFNPQTAAAIVGCL